MYHLERALVHYRSNNETNHLLKGYYPVCTDRSYQPNLKLEDADYVVSCRVGSGVRRSSQVGPHFQKDKGRPLGPSPTPHRQSLNHTKVVIDV